MLIISTSQFYDDAMSSLFEIYKDKFKEFRFRLKASNGENILASEGYKQKTAVLTGIESVKTNAQLDERFERKESESSEPYFVLRAANHEVIGRSEMYSSPAARDKGIDAVKRAARMAKIVELD